MLRELSSSSDSHHEYVMICATLQMCDGDMGGVVPFGKRDVESRDLSSKCCTGDMCNYPGSITTTPTVAMTTTMPSTTTSVGTVCKRDITFVVEDNSNRPAAETQTIVTFLKNLVSNIQIGKSDNLVSLSTFDRGTHEIIHFDESQTEGGLLHQLSNISFRNRYSLVDYDHVVSDLDHHIGGLHDPRSTKNVVVILIDQYAQSHSTNHHTTSHFHGKDVVVVDIGSSSAISLFNGVASDSNHVLAVPDFASLHNYVSQLINLICL